MINNQSIVYLIVDTNFYEPARLVQEFLTEVTLNEYAGNSGIGHR